MAENMVRDAFEVGGITIDNYKCDVDHCYNEFCNHPTGSGGKVTVGVTIVINMVMSLLFY